MQSSINQLFAQKKILQHFLRLLRAIFDDVERCHLLVTFFIDNDILGIICANRIRFAIGCGHSIDGHINID